MLVNKKEKLTTFETLAIPYLNFIYRSAYRLSGNRADAEDLAQETFRAAFEKFNQLRDTNKVKSWLFMILRNAFLKRIEKERKYAHIDIDLANYNPQDARNIGKEFFKRTLDGELQVALDRLAEKYKTPVVLSYIGGYSYQEIADMLHIPIGTVMSRIARGKMFLKKEIIEAGKQRVDSH